MVFGELKQHIRTGNLSPAYLVTGEDAFLVSSAVGFFLALGDPLPDFNCSVMTSPDDAVRIVEACESLPLGAERRVVLVHDCTVDLTRVEKYLARPCPSTVLVFVSAKPAASLAKLMHALTVVECNKLDRATVLKWIARRASELGASITTQAANLLVDYCALDMARISAELPKLCAFRGEEAICEADVAAMVAPTLDYKIFAIGDAVANKQPERVASVLKSLLDGGTGAMSVTGYLYSHFRRLLYVSITPSYERMPADLGVKEFAVRKAKEQAARFTPMRLKKICDALQRADYAVKSGRMSDRAAVELVVLQSLAT